MVEIRVTFDASDKDKSKIECAFDPEKDSHQAMAVICHMLSTGQLNQEIILSMCQSLKEQDVIEIVNIWTVMSDTRDETPMIKPSEVFSERRRRNR